MHEHSYFSSEIDVIEIFDIEILCMYPLFWAGTYARGRKAKYPHIQILLVGLSSSFFIVKHYLEPLPQSSIAACGTRSFFRAECEMIPYHVHTVSS
jgi:hypothetical protein